MKTRNPPLVQTLVLACLFAVMPPSLAWAGAPASSADPPSRVAQFTVQIDDIGGDTGGETGAMAHVALDVGDTLRVLLRATPSTGYGWQVAANNNALLAAGERKYLPAESRRRGGPGRQSLTFTAQGAGRDRLLLAYARPGEEKAPPARTLSLEIVIRDAGLRGDPAFTVRPAGVPVGRYVGNLPCADCSGIRESLALYSPGTNRSVKACYVRVMTYLGGRNGNSTDVTAGQWSVERGTPYDPNATVYALSLDSTDRLENYLLKGAILAPLDSRRNPVDSPFDLALHRIP